MWVTRHTGLKNFACRFKGLMQQQFRPPLENIVFAWVHVHGLFELGCRDQIVSGALFNLCKETVKLRRVINLKKLLNLAAGCIKVPRLFVSESEIVSVVVG